MKVVCISGSPRKNGNSRKMVDYLLEKFTSKGFLTEGLYMDEMMYPPCIHCNACAKEKRCTVDKIANDTNKILANADAIVFVSPVYFGGMTSQLKALIDKTLPLRRDDFKLKGKVGAAITVGGSRNGGQELTLSSIHAAMMIHGMVVVGDNSHFGGTVQQPFDQDNFGKDTVDGVVRAVTDLVRRLE